jgi:predicted PurR-regulated permease PerM
MDPQREPTSYARRVFLFVGVLGLAALAFWTISVAGRGVLIVLAGVVMAVALDGIVRRIPLPRIPALVAVLVLALAGTGGLSWWFGSALVEELEGVQERVVAAWPSVEAWLQERSWGRRGLEELANVEWATQAGGQVGSLALAAVGGVASILLIPVFAVFFAISPRIYVSAIVHLFPIPQRPRVEEVFTESARALRSWLLSRVISMAVVGLGTALGLWIAGVPLAFGLGLIAGVLSFIPNIGPVLAAIPGVLVGLSESPTTALWALGIYLAVQAVDNYVVTPLVSQRAVDLPAAAQLAAQLILGIAAAGLGVFMAIPLMIVIIVAVQAFYVRGVLGDRVPLLGQEHGKRRVRWFQRRDRGDSTFPGAAKAAHGES